MPELTNEEWLETLAAYREGTREVGPTMRWMAGKLGLSGSPVVKHRMERLVEMGWLERNAPKHHIGPYSITQTGLQALEGN